MNLRPYLPKSSITEKGYHWIHQAFSNVEYLKGQIYVDGKIADVPFSNKQGQFLLRAEAYLPEFKFTDDWPIATEVKAHIEVNNEVMNTTLLEAKLGHNQMDGLKMVLAPLDQHKQFIYLHSATHLDAKESLAYLFKTPLKDKIDILKKVDLVGPIALDFGLTIPLYPENDKSNLRGAIKFNHDQVSLCESCDIHLKSLTGSLFFDEDSILKSKLSATILNEPLDIELSHQLKPRDTLQLALNGRMSIGHLKQVMHSPLLDQLKGRFDYQATMLLPDTGDSQFQFTSSLKGVSSSLPYPMHKNTAMIEPLTISSRISDKERELDIDYNHILKAELHYQPRDNKMLLDHGAIQISKKPFTPSSLKGVSIDVDLRELDADKWYATFMSAKDQQNDTSFVSGINKVYINVDKLTLKGKRIKRFRASANKSKKDWHAVLSSSAFKGHLSIADAVDHEIYGHFDYLHLNENFKQDKTSSYVPDDIPPISLFIQKLDYNGVDLGELTYRSKTKNHQVLIDKLLLRAEKYYLSLNGFWDNDQTHLEGHWENRDLGKFLQKMAHHTCCRK